MGAPARPRRRLPEAVLLDGLREDARARPLRQFLPRRRVRLPRRVQRQRRRRPPQRLAGAQPRPVGHRRRHGRRDRQPLLHDDRQRLVRAAVQLRPPHLHARPHHRRAARLEHRHQLPALGRARHGQAEALGARPPLRDGRGAPRRRLPPVGGVLGRRRAAEEQGGARLRRSGAHQADRFSGAEYHQFKAIQRRRAVAAAHAGALPGGRLGPRPPLRRHARGGRVPERDQAGAGEGAGRPDPRRRRRGRAATPRA